MQRGAVLGGVGILVPLAIVDNWQADTILALTGWDPGGLVLTGTAFALVLAYCVRFFAIAQGGAADAAMGGRVSPPSLPMAARSLGRSAGGGALREVYVPPLIKARSAPRFCWSSWTV